ncbi:hypothetical protein QZH41_001972 [Actinostola sp. cb2023]|nr:hypothetical protein QZH41_001972 [Actinostola sp. cb2023]
MLSYQHAGCWENTRNALKPRAVAMAEVQFPEEPADPPAVPQVIPVIPPPAAAPVVPIVPPPAVAQVEAAIAPPAAPQAQQQEGELEGSQYDSDRPPPMAFKNNVSCKPFGEFIKRTLVERLRTGAISLVGRVGLVPPPHIVLPLTVEPTKPRLCHDARYLNLWMQDRPFRLDSLKDLPRYVSKDSYQTVLDDKSGYDHILLTDASQTYFGFQWGGWYFTYNTLPFGWKISPYIYHTTGLMATDFFRSLGIPCLLYIDDRHNGQLQIPLDKGDYKKLGSEDERRLAAARSTIIVVAYHLVRLGYFLGLSKSILMPSKVVPYLGFLVDSSEEVFHLMPEKKVKFLRLIRETLERSLVGVKTLQRLVGKCVSFSLAVPAARLFTREMNSAISRGQRTLKPIRVQGPLRDEISHWLFLESWDEPLPWRNERHIRARVATDASASGWGYSILSDPVPQQVSDYWSIEEQRKGKTQVHRNGCTFLGQRGTHPCECPLRLSYKTVDSYIGKLRSIFHAIGRDGEWDKRLGLGNPAADKSIKDYLRVVTAEQLQARITPKQATPFFVDKLTKLSSYLERALENAPTPTQRFIIARDQAYFKTAFFSGDRPGDLGQIKFPEILRFPNDDGFLFSHVWGKTLRDGDENVFGIRRNPQTTICPIRGIERYMEVACEMKIDLTRGYLFRPTTPNGGIQDSPMSSAAAEARLKLYLKDMSADDGETLHGFRSGCAITLALKGADLSEIMDHVGWARRHTALYYLQLAKVLNPDGASARLISDGVPNVINPWQDMNELKRFICAFPAENLQKRTQSTCRRTSLGQQNTESTYMDTESPDDLTNPNLNGDDAIPTCSTNNPVYEPPSTSTATGTSDTSDNGTTSIAPNTILYRDHFNYFQNLINLKEDSTSWYSIV